MSKDSLVKYYKKNKERLQKGLVKITKIRKKTKSENMVTNDKKIFLKLKNKG